MKKTNFEAMKKTLLAMGVAAAMCAGLTGCGASVNDTAQNNDNTVTAAPTLSATENVPTDTEGAVETEGMVEYTTEDAKFTASAGFEKEEGDDNRFDFTNNGTSIVVYDVGFWTTNPHPGNVTPKTEEELKPVDFFMNTNYTNVLDFEYSEDDRSESMYAAVQSSDKKGIIYVKYYVDKNDPEKIIYMEVRDFIGGESLKEDIAGIVKSFDWK